MIGYPISYGDTLTDEQALQNLKAFFGFGQDTSSAFYKGVIFGIITMPSMALAEDVVRNGGNAAVQEAQTRAAKRMSNAFACGAIAMVCKSKAGEKIAEQAVDKGTKLALTNPAMVGAFLCGASVAWCAKYVIFDK